jgi:hypothetical protein
MGIGESMAWVVLLIKCRVDLLATVRSGGAP